MENLSKNTQKEISRRELLKALAATTGAVAAASMLPSQWVSPVVEAGVLPAHAQGSTVSPTATPTATVVIRQTVPAYNFRVNGGGEKVGGTDSVTFTAQTAGTQYTLEYRYISPAAVSRAQFEYSINGGAFKGINALDPSTTDNSGSFATFNKVTLKNNSGTWIIE